MMKRLHLYLAIPALLAGCNGGSDGSGGTSSLGPVDSGATITVDNAPAIASAVTSAALSTNSVSYAANLMSAGGTIDGKQADSVMAKLEEMAQTNSKRFEQAAQAYVSQTRGSQETDACAESGSISVSESVAEAGALTPGDTYTAVYADCSDGDEIINGTLAMTVASFSGSMQSGLIQLGVDMTLTRFEVSDGTADTTVDGDLSMQLDTTSPPVASVSLSASNLTVDEGQATYVLSDFTFAATADTSATSYKLTFSGTLSSSAFAGDVTFETNGDLQISPDGNVFAGEIIISGAHDASIRMVALDGTNVSIGTDVNGDGIADSTTTMTWDKLMQ